MTAHDAVIVGARCAGATLALGLAQAGARVLMIDGDTFPSDTLSTHFLYPNTIIRLDELGVLDRIIAEHKLNYLLNRLILCGYEAVGPYTPIGDYDRGLCITRPVLDDAIIRAAIDAGAEARFGERVVGLLGDGTDRDPVRGVALDGGEEVLAPWTFGADGRVSFVARALSLEKTRPMSGEAASLFAYFRGLPENDSGDFEATLDRALFWAPCEDETHLVVLNGTPDLTRGDASTRARTFNEGIRSFPGIIAPSAFDYAEQIGDMRVAPETMLRGFFRAASGPGWALVGDAGHFKHPATAQGISDAIEQALYLARALGGDDPTLSSYESWRDARAAEHYEFSFMFAHWPVPGVTDRMFAGLTGDPDAMQQFRDVFSRLVKPSEVFTPERLAHWTGLRPTSRKRGAT